MRCRQAQKKLTEADWQPDRYENDNELLEHLKVCCRCSDLVRAEQEIRRDIEAVGRMRPELEMPIGSLREMVVKTGDGSRVFRQRSGAGGFLGKIGFGKLGLGVAVVLLAFLALVPFSFREKVGYEISISGVDRSIAMDSKGIVPLLDALGMEKDKAATLLNSIEKKEIQLKVGECNETCHLSISDLKTEKDVQLIIKAIIELGCCEIDNVLPIYRKESTSLLGHATRKLFS
nr:hypothetical protein [candidate division Zixibacteria bacterium]